MSDLAAPFTVFDAPEVLAQISTPLAAGQREVLLRVEGMHCGACVRRMENALRDVALQVRADVPSASCELRWQADRLPLSSLLGRIKALGFEPTVLPDDERYHQARMQRRAALKRIGVALLFGMQVMMLASAEYFGEVDPAYRTLLRHAQWLLATPVFLYAGWPFIFDGFRALLARSVTMDTPVAIAMVAAYGLSAWNTVAAQGHVYFDSVAMFVLLLSIARFWQQKGQLLAADRLRRLLSNQPLLAKRVTDDGIEPVPVSQLLVGQRVLVAPGEAVPADGRLCDAAELDESLLTGEALPQSRRPGESVLAGSVNLGMRPLELEVTMVGAQTVLSQIARLVQRAQMERPAFDTAVERVARHFVWLVLVLAGLAGFIWRADPEQALEAALAVLVVTCPCALSLAVPTSLAAAVTRLARQSVLLVRTDLLLHLGRLSDVCLDKTGTLTTRGMRIARVRVCAELDEAQCRKLAARLESGLNHPIARAFTADQTVAPADEIELRLGQGVFGFIEAQAHAITPVPAAQAGDQGGDPFLRWFALSRAGHTLAYFGLVEELRAGVRQAVQGLRENGLNVHLLSGDSTTAARAVGAYVGIDQVHAAQSPQDKLAIVRRLQAEGGRVMAVGDGVNDGPLLAGADASVGIASGAALTQAHGEAILMTDDLRGLGCLFEVGRRTRRIIAQNFAWALSYNFIMVPLAFMGWITPWLAALGMGGSSLLVTLNALRLLRGGSSYHCSEATNPEAVT